MRLNRLMPHIAHAAMLLTLLTCSACTDSNQERISKLPTVRVGLGMPFKELQAGSSYPFTFPAGEDPATTFQGFSVNGPYNLRYVDGGKEFVLDDIGGAFALTAIGVQHGFVNSIAVTANQERLSLDDALARVKMLREFFDSVGFAEAQNTNHGAFYVTMYKDAESGGPGFPPKAPITALAEARKVLLADPNILEMECYSLERKPGDYAGMAIRNRRRMQSYYRAMSPSELARTEAKSTTEREWSISLHAGRDINAPPFDKAIRRDKKVQPADVPSVNK